MTKTVRFGGFKVTISAPLEDRPSVLLIETSDGRGALLGDDTGPFTLAECLLVAREHERRGHAYGDIQNTA